MVGKSHLAFGAITGAALSTFVISKTGSANMQVIAIPLILIGSVLPDIDNPESTMGHKFPMLSKIINKIFGHRLFIHSVFCLALLYALIYLFPKIMAIIIATFLTILIFKSLKLPLIIKLIIGIPISLSLMLILISNVFLLIVGICFGFLGHTFLDLFTADGSGILYPIIPKISLRNVPSGKPGSLNLEELVFCIFMGIIIAGLIYIFKDTKGFLLLCEYLTR